MYIETYNIIGLYMPFKEKRPAEEKTVLWTCGLHEGYKATLSRDHHRSSQPIICVMCVSVLYSSHV